MPCRVENSLKSFAFRDPDPPMYKFLFSRFQAWVMLQSNAMCNVSLPELLNTVNKSGNVRPYYIYALRLTRSFFFFCLLTGREDVVTTHD